MQIHFKSKGFQEGYTHICGPDNSPLQYISFGRLQLKTSSEPYTAESGGNEVVLELFSGHADVIVLSEGTTYSFSDIGERESIFDGRPTLVCIPPYSQYTVKALTDDLDIAVCAGPCEGAYTPSVIRPTDSGTRVVGKGNYQRLVHEGTVGTGKTKHLMVGDTVGQPGCWSSYPPHKHDEAAGNEIPQEEVYFYRIRPEQGFAIQVLYDAPGRSDGRSDAYLIHDGDTMVLDHGYHPVSAPPGYQAAYIWVLYAVKDVYGAWSDDPLHAWVKEL